MDVTTGISETTHTADQAVVLPTGVRLLTPDAATALRRLLEAEVLRQRKDVHAA